MSLSFRSASLAAIVLAGVISTSLRAQVEADPLTVPVQFVLNAALIGQDPISHQFVGGLAGFSVAGSGYTAAAYPPMYTNPISANQSVTISMLPGKTYTMSMIANHVCYGYAIYVAPPSGYRIYINDIEQAAVSYSGSGYLIIPPYTTVRIDNGAGAGPGVASSLRPGRLIWTVGLGNLKNGAPAGVIALRQNIASGFSAVDFQSSQLIYNASSAEVQYYYSTNSPSFQIFANQCLVQMDNLPSGQEGFTMTFYDRNGVSSTITNGLWQPTGGAVPFATYRIENTTPLSYTTASKLRITRTLRINSPGHNTARVSRTELRQISGQPAGQTRWQVIDWTTNAIDGSNNLVPGESWSQWTYSNYGANEDIQIYNGSGTLAADTYNTYQAFPWGAELVRSERGYGGAHPLVTQYVYNTALSAYGNYARLQYVIEPTGKWIRYSYYDDNVRLGNIQTTYEPFGDIGSGPAASDYASGLVTAYNYSSDLMGGRYTRLSSIVRKVGAITAGQTLISYADVPISDSVTLSGTIYSVTRHLIQATTQSYSDSSHYLTSTRRYYREDVGMGLLPNGQYEVTRGFYPLLSYDATAADGSKQIWSYTRGVRDPYFWNLLPVAEGSEWYVRVERQGPSGPIDGGSTFQGSIHAFDGTTVVNDQGIYAQGAWHTTVQTRALFAACMVPYEWQTNSGTYLLNYWISGTNVWDGGLLVSAADASGITHDFQYNGIGWKTADILKASTAGNANVPANDIWTVFEYDGAGDVTSVRKQASANVAADDAVTTTAYDRAGRPTSTTSSGPNGNLTTSFTYFVNSDSKTTQITLPTGGTRIVATALDGRVKRQSGTALYGGGLSTSFTYGVDAVGNSWSKETPPTAGYRYAISDWLGRPIRSTTPGFNGARIATVFAYDAANGRMTKKQEVQADSLDNASFASTPMASGILFAYDALGRVTQECLDVNENGLVDLGGPDRIKAYSYSAVIDSQTANVPLIWAQQDVFAYPDGSSQPLRVQSNLQQLNENNTGTYSASTVYSRSKTRNSLYNGSNESTTTAIRTVAVTSQAATALIQTSVPGATNVATDTSINGFPVSSLGTDGVVSTVSFDSYGRKSRLQGRNNVFESYVYFPGTSVVQNVRNAYMTPSVIGNEWKTDYYDAAGRLVRRKINNVGVTGNTRYEYDLRGNLVHVWGNRASPVEYVYDNTNRRTNLRQYRDAANLVNWDAATWPGASAASDTTTWGHDATTGLITSKTYPVNGGASATVSFAYTGFNQLQIRTWGRGVQTHYAYYDASDGGNGTRGELKTISYPNSGTVGQCVLTPSTSYRYTRMGALHSVDDATGTRTFSYRPTDFQLASESLPSFFGSDNKVVTYTYDNTGVMDRVTGFQFGTTGSAAAYQQIGYGFESATGRLNSVSSWNANTGASRTFTYAYHPNSNLIETIASGSFQRHNYWEDWRNVVDTVATSWGSTNAATFTYGYDWDPKRQSEATTGGLTGVIDSGNTVGLMRAFHYTQRRELDYVDGHRLTNTNALNDPTQNLGAAIDDIARWWTFDNAGNRTSEQRVGWSLPATYTSNSLNQYSSVTGSLSLSLLYDADGNMTGDGTWIYYWDAENRLAQMSKAGMSIAFTYDYRNRRVAKTVTTTTAVTTLYAYNGWNLIAEYGSGSPTAMTNLYTWGLDASATIQGAGGVGGLLLGSRSVGDNLMPVYDGNGNVRGYMDDAGSLVAAYDYTPAGEFRIGSGSVVLPIAFASKYYDSETGLYQYNNRYYHPGLGRFISRDPINENGGLNLYAYCGNNAINRADYLGNLSLGDFLNPFSGKNPLNPFSNKNLKLAVMLPHYSNPLYWLAPNFYRRVAPAVDGMIVGAIVGYFAGPQVGGAVGGFISGFESSYLNGGSMSDAFASGLMGAVIGAAVGSFFTGSPPPAQLNYEQIALNGPKYASLGNVAIAGVPGNISGTLTHIGPSLWSRFVSSGALGAAAGGGAAYLGGLANGVWGAARGTANAIAHPINTFQGVANGLGTLAGRAFYDAGGLARDIGNGLYNTVMDPSRLGNTIGNVVGAVAIGGGITRLSGLATRSLVQAESGGLRVAAETAAPRTIGEILPGVHPDSMIHLTPAGPESFAQGVTNGTYWARAGDVFKMDVPGYQVGVVGRDVAASLGEPVSGFVVSPPGNGSFMWEGAFNPAGVMEYTNSGLLNGTSYAPLK